MCPAYVSIVFLFNHGTYAITEVRTPAQQNYQQYKCTRVLSTYIWYMVLSTNSTY